MISLNTISLAVVDEGDPFSCAPSCGALSQTRFRSDSMCAEDPSVRLAIIEREQELAILRQAVDGLGIFRPVLFSESIDRGLRRSPCQEGFRLQLSRPGKKVPRTRPNYIRQGSSISSG